jgi:hypothetical protein
MPPNTENEQFMFHKIDVHDLTRYNENNVFQLTNITLKTLAICDHIKTTICFTINWPSLCKSRVNLFLLKCEKISYGVL